MTLTEAFGNAADAIAHLDPDKLLEIKAVVPSGDIVPLYNPRKHKWSEHFSIDDGFILAKTSTGEGTITLLKLNDPDRLILRRILEEAGRYPM